VRFADRRFFSHRAKVPRLHSRLEERDGPLTESVARLSFLGPFSSEVELPSQPVVD
jgi:hypothetical protein